MDSKTWDIIGKHLKGESSEEETAILQQWLQESIENQELLDEVTNLWEKTGHLDFSTQAPKIDLDQEWNAFEAYRDRNESIGKKTVIPMWIYRVAAILIMCIGIVFYFLTSPDNTGQHITHRTQSEKMRLFLPDSSEIWLNKSSEISYQEGFGTEHRNLTLSGEAFFDVRKNNIPFTINTRQSKTEVLGTAFNLKSYESDSNTEITLIRGRLAFSQAKNPTNKVHLNPGEKAILKNTTHQIIKTRYSDPQFLAWKEDILLFNKTTLHEVFSTLEEYFDIKVNVENQAVYLCHFTGNFKKPKLNEILDVLSASINFTYHRTDTQVTISGGSCIE